jgi:hypothetical protein
MNQTNLKKCEILNSETDTILFIIKIVNSNNIMIVTKTKIVVYSLDLLKKESEIFLSPLKGNIMCYDFTKDFK